MARSDREQERWLDRDSVEQLVSLVRPWGRGNHYANLLRQLERQEADAIDLALKLPTQFNHCDSFIPRRGDDWEGD